MATKRTIRIDEYHGDFWRYGAYETRTFLGIKYDRCVARSDDLERIQELAREALKLPIYITSGDA